MAGGDQFYLLQKCGQKLGGVAVEQKVMFQKAEIAVYTLANLCATKF